MRSIAILAASCVMGVGAWSSSAAENETWLISADKIYTAPDVSPLSNGTVLVRNGRIAAIADEHSRIAIPKGARTSDCRGVVVAGFQNSHVHFMEPALNNAARAPAAQLASHLESMLTRFGFTTVFDTGSDQSNTLALRKRIGRGDIRGPRILTVGDPLYPPDGIPSYLQDMPPEFLARMHQPRNASEARAVVRKNLANGADGTKLFLHTSPDRKSPRFMSLEIARAAAEETHRQGKLVFAHPTSGIGLRNAFMAGVDVLVHTTLGEEQPWDPQLVGHMVGRKMSLIPTFKLWKYELRKENAPPPVIEQMIRATFGELHDFKQAGGQILFGTDVGYMRDYDPTDEYVYMSQAGMSPMDILASLTTLPAERWKEGKRRGRVAAGFNADLVVLEDDPATDVRNFARVRCAFRGGQLIYSAAAAP
jgi:imidazolonepropionase-like amidohydrolase